MKVTPLKISDVKLIQPDVFEDERGFFYESFNQKKFNDSLNEEIRFVQDNHSKSRKGVLRGLHFQAYPFSQGKLVRVIYGEIFDVAVDLRRESPTFGKWCGKKLSSDNKFQLWIPKGFAHGFQVLSNEAEVIYKVTDFYNPNNEYTLRYDIKEIDIDWPLKEFVLSDKDSKGLSLKEAEKFL